MKIIKTTLYALLFIDMFFLVKYFINFGSRMNVLWNVIFLIGIILSFTVLGKSKREQDEALLSMGVLTLSLSSIGGYIFNFYLTHSFG
ncbi:hypothetical protein D1970_05460 [Mesobacillus zeae]|uniref:Uncharacterized protein n=1 Tax=Mesobacillus zeae TaxID=1917180 RepID=A0A398BD95_9BACI|nr:hypothetical protein D1970_05460 [Mesobacillus zeae]